MQKQFYDNLAAPFERDETKKKVLIYINRIITGLVFLSYPALIIFLLVMRDARVIRVIIVPAATFAAVTIFRGIFNSPRPYEVWDTPPLINKDTKGNSFPSRHVFSVFIIAAAAGYIYPPAGVILAVLGAVLAAVRVITRVHFIKDVAAGAAIAVILGYIGFYVI